MNILITGAAGMLGSDLSSVLKKDHSIYQIGRSPAKHLSDSYRILDISNHSELVDLFLSQRFDLVVHAAAYTKVDLCEAETEIAMGVNFAGTKNIVDLCKEYQIPLLFFSTDYVFHGDKNGEYLESDTINPINYYGETKAAAEKYIVENAYQAMIWRVTWLYGKYGYHFPGAILKQAQAGKEKLTVVSDQFGRPTYTYDLAIAVRDLISSGLEQFREYSQEVFHVGNSGSVNWANFAREVLNVAGYSQVVVEGISSDSLDRAAKRPANSVLCLDKAKRCLGLELRSWNAALKDFLEKEKEKS